jgi:hypothetical protein
VTLSAVQTFDLPKFITLLHVYQRSTDPYVRQRALVGWVFALQSDDHLADEPENMVQEACRDAQVVQDVIDLQKQLIFCVQTKQDNEEIQKDIIPSLMKNNNFAISRDGIITEKDIFQAFTDLLGYKHQGTRFVFQCDDRPGFFAGIAQLLADNEANMEAMAVYHTKGRGTEAVVKATGEISVKNMVDILVNAGYKLNNVTQTTKFGTTKTFDI